MEYFPELDAANTYKIGQLLNEDIWGEMLRNTALWKSIQGLFYFKVFNVIFPILFDFVIFV